MPDFIENHKADKLGDLPYYGVFPPAGTPKVALDQFSAALAKVVAQPEVHNRLTAMGLTVGFMTQ